MRCSNRDFENNSLEKRGDLWNVTGVASRMGHAAAGRRLKSPREALSLAQIRRFGGRTRLRRDEVGRDGFSGVGY
jgi:hypothetical protein